MSFHETFGQLKQYVRSLTRDIPELKDERADAFPYWFAQATLLHPDAKDEILRSLVGRSYDKNIDIVTWSDMATDVYICQTKYRDSLQKHNETQNDLNSFARIAGAFTARTEGDFLKEFPHANRHVQARLRQAWPLVRKHDYELKLFYVTTGKSSAKAIEEAQKICRGSFSRASLLVYSGHDCCRIFEDFQSLVPAIPYVDFTNVRARMPVYSLDTKIKSVVFPAHAANIKKIFGNHGERLFARNVRLDKGETAQVNREISTSLRGNPKHFLYYNNGLTVLGRDVEVRDDTSGDQYSIRVYEPQIINGQQTTRTIARSDSLHNHAEVLVRVVCRQPQSDEDIKEFRHFIAAVVRATNSQTKVTQSELASNNPEQIDIQRALKHLDWRYVRKVGRSENDWHQGRPHGSITLKELATALVSCLVDPQFIRREGIETLFSQDNRSLYSKVFSEKRPIEQALLTFLLLELADCSKAYNQRRRRQLASLGQYYVAYKMYQLLFPASQRMRSQLNTYLTSKMARRRFSPDAVKLREWVLASWLLFYQNEHDADDDDPLSFVSTTATAANWNRFWNSRRNAANRSEALRYVRRIELETAEIDG